MKLIIAGSRDFDSREIYKILCDRCVSLGFHGGHPSEDGDIPPTVTEVVSGECRGVDTMGESWAGGQWIPVKGFPYPSKHGRAGGPIRNKQMAEYADALLLVWNGKSSGSGNMKKEMMKLNKPIYEIILRGH